MLAAAYMPDSLDEPFDFSANETLYPGIDHHDDVTYITTLAHRKVAVNTGRGATKRTHVETQDIVAVVASTGETFEYETEALDRRGFRPAPAIMVPDERRWSREAIEAFCAKPSEDINPWKLFLELRSIYDTYVEFTNPAYLDLMPLWIMAGYVFRAFHSFPYVHFNGTKGTGKSQNLAIIKALGLNATYAGVMTSSTLFRTTAGKPGVLCLDEAETFEGERGNDLLQILNMGYKAEGNVPRSTKPNENSDYATKYFNVYGPKAIASIAPLPEVTQNRALVVTMRQAYRDGGIPSFASSDTAWQTTRDHLYIWAMHHYGPIKALNHSWTYDDKRIKRAPRLTNRAWEIAGPLVITAEYIGGADLSDIIIAFLQDYYIRDAAKADATDRHRVLLTILPTIIRANGAWQTSYYPLSTIRDAMKVALEDDQRERFTSRTCSRLLTTIGFTEIKQRQRQGTWISIPEDELRIQFISRKVNPIEEDTEWLAGKETYQHENPPEQATFTLSPPVPPEQAARTREAIWERLQESED